MLVYDHAQTNFAIFKARSDGKTDNQTTNFQLFDLTKTENKMENESEYICIFAEFITRFE
jgi:hypothetical protein